MPARNVMIDDDNYRKLLDLNVERAEQAKHEAHQSGGTARWNFSRTLNWLIKEGYEAVEMKKTGTMPRTAKATDSTKVSSRNFMEHYDISKMQKQKR